MTDDRALVLAKNLKHRALRNSVRAKQRGFIDPGWHISDAAFGCPQFRKDRDHALDTAIEPHRVEQERRDVLSRRELDMDQIALARGDARDLLEGRSVGESACRRNAVEFSLVGKQTGPGNMAIGDQCGAAMAMQNLAAAMHHPADVGQPLAAHDFESARAGRDACHDLAGLAVGEIERLQNLEIRERDICGSEPMRRDGQCNFDKAGSRKNDSVADLVIGQRRKEGCIDVAMPLKIVIV